MIARRRLTSMVTAFAVLVVAACDDTPTDPPTDGFDPEQTHALLDSEADIFLSTDEDAYSPGAEVVLTLENRSGETVGYNLCFHGLERRHGDGWTSAGDQLRICTTVLHLLEDGVTATYPATLPASLGAGEYRFRTSIHLMERAESRDQVTEPFEVDG